MTKPGLSIERHHEIGLELAAINDRLAHLRTEVGNAYPRTGPKGRLLRGLEKLHRQLGQVRSDGENTMFADHGDAGSTFAYYPTRQTRDQERP